VNGAAHQPDAHRAPFRDQPREIVCSESLEPGPESDVRIQRYLRLHADEMFDGTLRRHVRASEQELPL